MRLVFAALKVNFEWFWLRTPLFVYLKNSSITSDFWGKYAAQADFLCALYLPP